MQHVINAFLGFPDGSVWGNLIAEVLVAAPAWFIGYWRLKKLHVRHHAEVMRHLDPQGLNGTGETIS